jgi:hypothetical protein
VYEQLIFFEFMFSDYIWEQFLLCVVVYGLCEDENIAEALVVFEWGIEAVSGVTFRLEFGPILWRGVERIVWDASVHGL